MPTTWVLTGANRGLGLEFVRQLSGSADNVLFAGVRSLSTGDLSDLQAVISASRAQVHLLECDSASRASIEGFASSISRTLGQGRKLDYLLNVAGINDDAAVPVLPPSAPGKEGEGDGKVASTPISEAMLQRHMSVNVLGPTVLATALDAHLLDGSVVMNMTSGLGSLQATLGMRPRKCPVYSASKAALDMVSLHLEGEWRERGKKVVVIVMDPGWVKTRMGGEGAVLEPEESIAGMLKVLRGLDEGRSGRFYAYHGGEVGW